MQIITKMTAASEMEACQIDKYCRLSDHFQKYVLAQFSK